MTGGERLARCWRPPARRPDAGSQTGRAKRLPGDSSPLWRHRAARRCLRITGGILRVMQTPAPPLLPLLRSRLQAELLTVVLLTPGREWSLTELADRAGSSLSSAQREMARAEEAG